MVFGLRSEHRTMKGGQYAWRHPPLRLQYLETESIKNCILKLQIRHARTKYRVIARACAAERRFQELPERKTHTVWTKGTLEKRFIPGLKSG